MNIEENSMNDTGYDVIVIGGGPAGLSAAQYASRSGLKTLVIDKNPGAGALGSTLKIENYPGVPASMTGTELLEIFRKQAEGFGAKILRDQVYGVELEGKEKKIYTAGGEYTAKSVIIATGSMGRKPGISGEEKLIGRGVSYCATCDAPFHRGKEVAIAGGISEIIEEIDGVLKFVSKIHLIPQGAGMTDELTGVLTSNPQINFIEGAKVIAINGESSVTSVSVKTKNGAEEDIPVSAVFLYLHGNSPVIDYLYDTVKTSEGGCLSVNREDMSASIPGVFAAGDVSCKKVRQVVLATAEGCLAALSAEKYLAKREGFRAQWG